MHVLGTTSNASAMTFDGVLTLCVPALAPKRFNTDGTRRDGGSSISTFRLRPAFLWMLPVAAACIATTAMQGKRRSRIIGPHFGLGEEKRGRVGTIVTATGSSTRSEQPAILPKS